MSTMDNILGGNMEHMPPPCPTAVRVFISSTFTDMTEDRNIVMNEAVPCLKMYCNMKGFDFEIVDMRWGVSEDAANDHTTTEICLKEIENCQHQSLGPNFVVFVGDKYGLRSLPARIPVTEFRLFRRMASWMQLKFETVEKWYLLDTNCVPHVYHMQSISALLPYYNNLNPVNANRRLMHQQNWECDERNMINVFRKVSLLALEQKKISELDCAKYFISVTANEVQKGIFSYPQVKDRVLYFDRTLLNINTEDAIARRFTDLTKDGEIDEEVKGLREKLKSLLPEEVPEEQVIKYTVSWTPKGIDPENDEHARYLTILSETFKSHMIKQIDKSIKRAQKRRIQNPRMNEILHHARFGQMKCSCFYGLDEFINQVYDVIHTEKKTNDEEGGFIPTTTEVDPNETNANAEEEEQNVDKEDAEEKGEEEENEKGNNEEIRESVIYDEDGNIEKEDSNEQAHDENAEEEEEEKDDNDVDEESDASATRKKEIQKLREVYKQMGDKAPTFAAEDFDNDTASDPTRNAKDELLNFTCTDKVRHPVVIYGDSGCGKTSFMAKFAKCIKMWQPHAVVIIRFLGTTADSSNIRNLLSTIIQQIWAVYKMNPPTDMDFSADVIYLGLYLQALIWKVASSDRPLYIFLDSLDQLHPMEQAHGLAWLPVTLPEHCCMLLSTLPHEWGCLDSARRMLQSESQFIEMPTLNVEAADKIISAICNFKGRAITRPQRNLLLEHFQECPNPLYLRLIIEQALTWRSHQQVKDLILGSDINHAINHVFMNLERSHGITLVSKAFGYMTAMKRGTSYTEMEDILSLDNEVLHDTYLFHLPPCPTLIRLPPSLWARVLTDAREYLSEEEIGGKMIANWYHRLFMEVAMERYLAEEVRLSIHRLAAHYFLGYWYDRKKPLKLFKNKKGWYPDCVRGVPNQALVNRDGSLNSRKLLELPHHLAHAGMWREFHKEITCNIEWLVAKAKIFGATELKADLMFMMKQRNTLSEEIVKDIEDEPPKEEKEENEQKEEKEEEAADEKDTKDVDDELFITENKKVGDAEDGQNKEKEQEEEQVKEEWHTPEVEYVPDLATAMRDLEILLDIITMGMDCIRQSANNIPVQVISQLGKTRASSPGLKKLVEDSYHWMEENKIPLFIPQDSCMPPPGEMLQTTLSADLHLLGADRTHDHPVQLSRKDNYLYVVQQSNQKMDNMIVLDLGQGGERVMVEDMKCYVHSFKFNASERYMVVCAYQELSKYQAVFNYHLYERCRMSRYTLDKEAKSMDVSYNGDIVAYADDHICYICSPKPETLTVDVVYRLHHQEIITNILFSPDAYYLLTFTPGDGFKVWVPRRGESTLTIEGKKVDRFSMTETSGKHVRIMKNQHLIQVLSGYTKANTLRIYDLSNGEMIHELQNPELAYDIVHIDLDDEEEYVLVSTESTGEVNGNKSKSAIVWDTETGKLVTRITSDRAFSDSKLLVSNKTIYMLAAYARKPTVFVYSGGPKHRPLAGAKLVRKVEGHTREVLQILPAVSDNNEAGGDRLISVAVDNTVKIWDLKQVLIPPPKTKEVDIGASINLVYTKSGDAIYFATDKGFIIRQCAVSGEKTTLAADLGGPVHIMYLSKNGRLLIAAVHNMVYVYYIETGELEYTLESCCQSRISCMAENNNVLIAGHSGMEGKGRLWDLSNGGVLRDVSFLYSFYQAAVNSRGTQFGVTMFEYPLMINVFETGEEERSISMQQVDTMMSACSHLEFTPDAKMLVSASSDGRIRIIDTETGRYLHTMFQRSSITALLITWDSRQLFTAGYRAVYIWNIGPEHPPDVQGQLVVKLSRHSNFVTRMQLVLDDRYLLTASMDKTVALWSMKTKTTLCSFCYHCSVDVMAVAPDLSTLAFIPERSPTVAVLSLNKCGKDVLKGIPSVPVPPKVKRAQAVALSFSSQQVTQKTSTACCIL